MTQGDVIRIGPNELSFASVQAFKDLYGPPSKTRQLFHKSHLFYDTGIQSIVYEIDPLEHEKQHRLFAPSFRASAVRSQEHVVQEHVDLLVEQLRSQGRSGQIGLDLAAWMEWLAFDIIGESLKFWERTQVYGGEGMFSRKTDGELFTSIRRVDIRGVLWRHPCWKSTRLGLYPTRLCLRCVCCAPREAAGHHRPHPALGAGSIEIRGGVGQSYATARRSDAGEDPCSDQNGEEGRRGGLPGACSLGIERGAARSAGVHVSRHTDS